MKLFFTFLLFFPLLVQAQKLGEVEIVKFDDPYESIILSIDDNNIEYKINEKTRFKSKKNRDLGVRYFLSGSYIDLEYQIDGRERFAKSIKLLSDYSPGKEDIKGLLDSYEGESAFIDGRKVILDGSSKLICEGTDKCGCTKGMVYLDFKELRLGDFMFVKGDLSEEGQILVNEIKVCQNNFNKYDQILHDNVIDALRDNTVEVESPSGISVPRNSLHKGNISIGAFEYKLHEDIYLQGYINVLGNKLVPEYAKTSDYKEKHKRSFRFYVLDNSIPNAFAFPNGMLFITEGLLKIVENEAQLASILGHEIAHITYDHGSTRLEKEDYIDSNLFKSGGRSLIKLALPDSGGGIKGSVLKGAGDAILATKPSDISNLYNKSLETQADRIGLYYAYKAGYDIRESVNFWKNMFDLAKNDSFLTGLKSDFKTMILNINLEVDGKVGEEIAASVSETITDNFLNTVYTSHPNCKSRIRDINDLLNTVYEKINLDLVIGKEVYQKATENL